jgi:hypothetical protein
MLAILRRSPVETAGLTLCFDRQPDIFTMADLKYDPAAWSGLFESGVLAGFGLVGCHQAYVNGAVHPVMRVTDFYVQPEFRGRGFLKGVLPRFFDEGASVASLGYVVIIRGIEHRRPFWAIGSPLLPAG